MMDEIMRQEERILLNQIAKLTEEGHLAWDCVEYNPIGFLDKDEYSEQSACICQMFQFEATIGGLPHELELAEYINVPSGKMDLAVTLTRNDEEHFMKIDSILSVELDPYINATPQSIESMAAVRLAKSLVPLAAKTDVVAEAFSWARFINQTGISRTLLNHPLTKLGAGRKILCKRFSTKSRMALESRADSGLDPLITESHGGQSGMRAGTA